MSAKLKKELNFLDVFSIASGAMISSGIFILPGIAFSRVGPSVFISYFLAGLLAMAGILSIAELATAMPKAGGDYYFITRSLGPMIGTVSGFLSWFALSLKSAFAILGLSEVVYHLTNMNLFILSCFFCIMFVILNIVGVKEAAKFEIFLVLLLLLLIIFYIVIGIKHFNITHFKPFAPNGINSILMTSGFIFISFGGLLKISSVAEEVKNPGRNIPLSLISSVITITVLYTLMLIVSTSILPAENFANSLTPIADSAKLITGNWGYYTITFAAVLAFVTTANAGIMSASRYPMALSRDKLLPQFISTISKRFKTPIISILITGIFIIFSLLLELEVLVKIASTVVLTSYVLSNISVIVLRESHIVNYQPSFKSPFYPWLQLFSIFIFTFFIIDLGLAATELSISLFIFSLVIYFFYGKKKIGQEYALLHIIERITDKEITHHNLETELREIIREREGIKSDKFDKLVKSAKILDLKGPLELEDFIQTVSVELEKLTNINHDTLYNMLLDRELTSSTAVSDFVAIPHIILENSKNFNLLIIRCKEGIKFLETNSSIKAVFVFTGTKSERIFHLKTLASIAILVQEKGFEEKWLKAKNENYLKDLILLSKRFRY